MGGLLSGGNRVNSGSPPATTLRIQTSVYGQPIPFIHGQTRVAENLLWYGNFNYTSGSSGKGGKGGVVGGSGKSSGGNGASYSASFAGGLCEGPIDTVLTVWDNQTPDSLGTAGFSIFDGYQGQAAWSYLSSDDPSQAIGYSSLAYVAVANLPLGNQPTLPNWNFEVRGAISSAVTETYTISSGSSYAFTPTYWNLASSVVEDIVVPATPYQYQAQNYLAKTALPVILGNITIDGFASGGQGVVDANTGFVFTQIFSGTPTTGQFLILDGPGQAGLYEFAAADEGRSVIIIDLPVAPGVNYIYQPTCTTTSGSTSLTAVSSTANLAAGQLVTGTGIAPGTVITAVGSGTLTISQAATASGSGVTLTCWGAALTQVLAPVTTPGTFAVSIAAGSYGQYKFAAADNGNLVGIIDIPDADPSLSLVDFLTNPRYGVGFPAANLGSLATLQQYAFANSLFISPAFVQQQSAQDYFKDFSTGLNGEFVWSTGLLTWQPYGDTSATGNGYTYTPPSQAIYSLGDDDFLKNEGTSSVGVSAFTSDDPVVCSRKRPSDAYNDVKLEYLDRGNSYNPAIVEAKDDAAINAYGLRPQDTKTLHFFANVQSAITSAQLQLGRQMVRNQYTFTVPWYYILLDPMDIIEITDPNLGLNNQWVRILEITENQQDSTLTFTAEEYMEGTGSSPLYGTQVKGGYTQSYNVDPGQAIAPIIFEAPVQIATNSGLEIWLSTGGGSNWGGADVYTSTDNETYKLVGRYQGSSRIGVNASDFPSNSDPDTSDTLAVTLSTAGELYSGSQSDADLGHTLCYEGGYPNPPAPTLSSVPGGSLSGATYYVRITYVFGSDEGPPSPEDSLAVSSNNLLVVTSPVGQTGATDYNVYVGTSNGTEELQNASPIALGTNWTEPTSGLISGTTPPPSETSYELVAYETATFVSGTEYDLGTYIRRGMYGTTISDHPAGSQFARLDGSQLTFPYDKSQIGQTIYLKLLSFNLWGGSEYSLADVQPFTHVIEGPPIPGTVTGFAVQQQGNNVVFAWTDLSDDALKGYDLLYGPQGGSVANATMLTEASRATEVTTASVPPGAWTFYIRGHDIADQLGPVSMANLTVLNNNTLIDEQQNEPSWLGCTLSGFLIHYTGVLVPDSTVQANAMTNAQLFEQFVPFPVSNPTCTAPVIDTGFSSTFRVFANIAATVGRGLSGTPSITFSLDYWPSGSDPGIFYPWTVGNVTAEYLVGRITMNTAVPSYVSAFDVIADAQQSVQANGNFSVGSSGTTWTFPNQFHSAPAVQVTPTSFGATSGSATSVTSTSAFIQLWNGTTEVAGTASVSATGE